ncbi:MAG: hypothetical protein FJZ01_08885 [Candidatus Sericytochromatia bacterium]|nr:hypothetical protein [Candidatus Tanganyikabacteria bacterium]
MADAPRWLVVPVADLLADLWVWPGGSEFIQVYVARPLLAAIAAQAAFKPTEIGGYLLGRHYILRDGEGRDRHVTIIINSYKVEGAAGSEEFSFGQGTRARDLKGIAEIPELRDLEIVGWYHSHHNRGAYLSPSVDQPLHRRYFPDAYQVAYVLDMPRRQAGFFIWEGAELLAGPGQCLALFDPTTLEVTAIRKGGKRADNTWLLRMIATWTNESLRDGMVAVAALLLGLSAFVYAFGNRPFLAWTVPGTQEIRWEATGGQTARYELYRTTTAQAKPSVGSPFARPAKGELSLDLVSRRNRALLAPADIGRRYWYRVAALDAAGVPLRWSRPVPVVVPLNRPPSAPEARFEVTDARDKVRLKIGGEQAPDALGYWLIREGPLTTKTNAVLNGGKPVDMSRGPREIEDLPPEAGAYRYLAIPQDWSGNSGYPWDSAAIAVSGRNRGFLGLF